MTLRDDFIRQLESEIAELREQNATLEGMLGFRLEVPLVYGLTNHEARLLGLLMKRDLVTKDMAHTGLYGLRTGGADVEIKIIDVFVCKMRRKLKPFGVEIETVWGQGYRMTAENKAVVNAMLDAQVAA